MRLSFLAQLNRNQRDETRDKKRRMRLANERDKRRKKNDEELYVSWRGSAISAREFADYPHDVSSVIREEIERV